MANFINSKWRRDIGDNAVNAVSRVAGCGLAAVALQKMTSAEFSSKSDLNKTIANVVSPTVAVLGLVGDMFLANPMLRGFCQGLYTYAIPKTVAVIAPVVGNYMGLSGIDDMPAIMNGISYPPILNGATQTLPSVSASVREEVSAEDTVQGVANEILLSSAK